MSMGRKIELEEQYDKIYRYCYYKLHQRELAEDVTQETFLRYLRNERYQRGEEPLKVLYTIARNLCIDESRRKKPVYFDETGAIADLGMFDLESSVEDTVLTEIMIKDALEKLGEEERDIVFLRIANEVPLAVVGEMFRISRYAVHRRCERALKILRKELGKL